MTINDYTLNQYAADVAGEIIRECGGDCEAALDMAHESANGSEWVLYSHKAHELCQNCDTRRGDQFYADCGPMPDATYNRVACIVAYGELVARIETAINAQINEAEAAR